MAFEKSLYNWVVSISSIYPKTTGPFCMTRKLSIRGAFGTAPRPLRLQGIEPEVKRLVLIHPPKATPSVVSNWIISPGRGERKTFEATT